jgi:DNA-directed RNA polymerase subunit RPC12/RpoP
MIVRAVALLRPFDINIAEIVMTLRSGTCPKCGSKNILVSKKPKNWNALTGQAIFVKGFPPKLAHIRHYVCADCSFIESYVAGDDSMRNILEEWYPLNQKRKNSED